jgi:hypothetical protein
MISTTKPKRKPHRRGASKLLGPTGNSRGTPAAQRQCLICKKPQDKAQLLELGLLGPAGAVPAASKRHSYVCVAHGCLELAARRFSGHPHDLQAARLAFGEPLVQLATTRVKEAIGLARRQGLLVMGAARLFSLRASADDIFMDDEDDQDDEGDKANALSHTVVGGGLSAAPDVSLSAAPSGQQDVILVANDAALRTVRRLGPVARPCMLSGAQMGQAAGGAYVAAVGIPAGRLALQAAYWLQVWYEARLVTTPESMIN